VEDVTTNTLSSTFRYYLDNQLDLTLTAKASKVNDSIENDNEKVDTSLNMGVSYRLR
jgi:predicted porin